jgi:hypothetical protein
VLRLLVLEANTATGRPGIAETAAANIAAPADASLTLPQPLDAWKFVLNRDVLSDDWRQTELKKWIASLEWT